MQVMASQSCATVRGSPGSLPNVGISYRRDSTPTLHFRQILLGWPLIGR
jgi:hypothetical protein